MPRVRVESEHQHTMGRCMRIDMRMRSQRKRANAGQGVDEGDLALSDESTRRSGSGSMRGPIRSSLVATDALDLPQVPSALGMEERRA